MPSGYVIFIPHVSFCLFVASVTYAANIPAFNVHYEGFCALVHVVEVCIPIAAHTKQREQGPQFPLCETNFAAMAKLLLLYCMSLSVAVVFKLATRIFYTGSQLFTVTLLSGEIESDNSMSAELFVVMHRRVLGVGTLLSEL